MIEAEKATYPIERMCELLEVSRSGFYQWRSSRGCGPSPSQRRRAALDAKVAASHAASDGVYGAPRVLADLRADGERVSRKTVAASLRRQGWPASARVRSRRPPRWSTWTRRYRGTW